MLIEVMKEIQDTTITLKIKGVLDISTTNEIDPYLDYIEGMEMLIFDFKELEFIDSTGIGSIVNAIHLSQEKRFKIKFDGVDELKRQIFETVGLYQILEAVQGEVL
jgi:anti-anti-sigma factor